MNFPNRLAASALCATASLGLIGCVEEPLEPVDTSPGSEANPYQGSFTGIGNSRDAGWVVGGDDLSVPIAADLTAASITVTGATISWTAKYREIATDGLYALETRFDDMQYDIFTISTVVDAKLGTVRTEVADPSNDQVICTGVGNIDRTAKTISFSIDRAACAVSGGVIVVRYTGISSYYLLPSVPAPAGPTFDLAADNVYWENDYDDDYDHYIAPVG